MRNVITAAFALLAAAPAAAQGLPSDPKLDRVLAGRVAGPPVRCIPLRPNTQSTVVPGAAIVYRDGARLYVNRPSSGADGLRRDLFLVTRPVISQLCSGEPVQLIDQVTRIQRDVAILGEFVPYSKPAKLGGR